MLDVSGPRGRIIAAALKLAADGPWKDVRLIDIAEEAGVTLADVRAEFDGKPAIISGFVRAVGEVARMKGLVEPGYRLLANIGQHGGQEVPHLHVHIFGGQPLGMMIARR